MQRLSNSDFGRVFSNGNVTLYSKDIPEASKCFQFITEADFKKGIGYELQVKYNFSLGYVPEASAEHAYGVSYSTVRTGYVNMFSGPNAFAGSDYENDNTNVWINPGFFLFAPGNTQYMAESYEELLAHEVGFHNSLGKGHLPYKNGNAIYPATNVQSIGGVTHGMITPTETETKELLEKAVKDRGRLERGPSPTKDMIGGTHGKI
ncbi:hypothetical protein [Chitinophaga sp. CF418]|uniref:hypothetical protein n=1 Tax=Chitinophaga sp. CF418 TaxID=1855287 RepID=UPI001CB82E0C|nr:hypothetical protein [Chitinophaga sp. CF418]